MQSMKFYGQKYDQKTKIFSSVVSRQLVQELTSKNNILYLIFAINPDLDDIPEELPGMSDHN